MQSGTTSINDLPSTNNQQSNINLNVGHKDNNQHIQNIPVLQNQVIPQQNQTMQSNEQVQNSNDLQNYNEMINQLPKTIDGKGGGRSDFAQGAGETDNISDFVTSVVNTVKSLAK